MAFLTFVAALVSDFWRAFTIACLWNWFIGPYFDARGLNTGIVFLMLLALQVVRGFSTTEKTNDELWLSFLTNFVGTGVVLAACATIHFFFR